MTNEKLKKTHAQNLLSFAKEKFKDIEKEIVFCMVDVSHYKTYNQYFVKPLKEFPFFIVKKANDIKNVEGCYVYSHLFYDGCGVSNMWRHVVKKEIVDIFSIEQFEQKFCYVQLEFSF